MTFEEELRDLINKHSLDNDCNTPDFIMADLIYSSLTAFAGAMGRRDAHKIGGMWPVDAPVKLPVYKNPPPGGRLERSKFGGDPSMVRDPASEAPMVTHERLEDIPDFKHSGVILGKSAKPYYEAVKEKDWRAPLMKPLVVEGHLLGCKIDLDVNWHDCTCEAG